MWGQGGTSQRTYKSRFGSVQKLSQQREEFAPAHGLIVADVVHCAKLGAGLCRKHGGDAVIDVDQVEPAVGIGLDRLASMHCFLPKQTTGAVDAGEAEHDRVRQARPEQLFCGQHDLS